MASGRQELQAIRFPHQVRLTATRTMYDLRPLSRQTAPVSVTYESAGDYADDISLLPCPMSLSTNDVTHIQPIWLLSSYESLG